MGNRHGYWASPQPNTVAATAMAAVARRPWGWYQRSQSMPSTAIPAAIEIATSVRAMPVRRSKACDALADSSASVPPASAPESYPGCGGAQREIARQVLVPALAGLQNQEHCADVGAGGDEQESGEDGGGRGLGGQDVAGGVHGYLPGGDGADDGAHQNGVISEAAANIASVSCCIRGCCAVCRKANPAHPI